MANLTLDAGAPRANSPIVAAYLRAFRLDRDHDESSSHSPDAQFAWAAMEGASIRAMECGIDTLDHAALAALLTFDAIDSVIDGLSVDRGGEAVITVKDAREGFKRAKKAMQRIFEFAEREGAVSRDEWAPVLSYYGADKK